MDFLQSLAFAALTDIFLKELGEVWSDWSIDQDGGVETGEIVSIDDFHILNFREVAQRVSVGNQVLGVDAVFESFDDVDDVVDHEAAEHQSKEF